MGSPTLTATLHQVIRYGVVGVINNLLGYVIYLLVTWWWIEPKLAVTFMYPIGAVTAYFGHAKYAFAYQGRTSRGLVRYVLAHVVGYSVNVGMLYVFADRMGLPHQLVQAAAIVAVAGLLFLLFRYFVFPRRTESS